MKKVTVTISYTQTVVQQCTADLVVPEHLAIEGGNSLRDYIQDTTDGMFDCSMEEEEVIEDLIDMIVLKITK